MIFEANTQLEERDILAAYLPDGAAWESKNIEEANLYKLVLGLSGELVRFQQQIDLKLTEIDILQTTLLITEWEVSVGIPDQCIGTNFDIQTRRDNVVAKLARFPGTTLLQDIQNVIDFFGLTATAVPGFDFEQLNPGTFPDTKTAKYSIVIDLPIPQVVFPLPFAIPFTSDLGLGTVLCVLLQLVPGNVDVKFVFTG